MGPAGKALFLSTLCIFLCNNLLASTTLKPDVKIRAAYIYKFTKFISWPETAFQTSTSNFTICIANNKDDEISKFLKNGLFGRYYKSHPLIVEKITADSIGSKQNTLDQCHILYITESAPSAIIEQTINTSPHLLTINASNNINANSIINFLEINKRIIFSIDSTQLNKSNINISATLLTLARNIKGADFDK